jgi:glycoprotein-N-acetylgalactosamine 3-beta-galactosyltransferase
LWGKTKQGLQQVYEHYGNDYDWFLKADDDTWIFVENLRYFLYPYSPSYPIYFGCKLKPYVNQGYMSGSAYVMSREALRRFNEEALGIFQIFLKFIYSYHFLIFFILFSKKS